MKSEKDNSRLTSSRYRQETQEGPGRTSPERKTMKIYQERSLLKRPYSAVSKCSGNRCEVPSPERKRRKICRERAHLKRPYSEISKDSEENQEFRSPERKRRRICIQRPVLIRLHSEVSQCRRQEIASPARKRRRTTTAEKVKEEVKEEEKVEEQPSPSKQHPSQAQSQTPTGKDIFRSGLWKEDRKEDKKETKIWIIGSSYIEHGEKAALNLFGENFGLNAKVEWFGKGGIRWCKALPSFYAALSTHKSPPDIVVFHAGGNDLGLIPPKELACNMKRNLTHLHGEFPSMLILFSCINERQVWRYGRPCKMDTERKKVNSLVKRIVCDIGGKVIEHPLLRFTNKRLFMPDGVHFTKTGNKIFLSRIRAALQNTPQLAQCGN